MLKAWRKAVQIAKTERVQSVITVSNPPIVGMIGRRVAMKLDIPFHYILFDIHPDALTVTGSFKLPPGVPRAWNWLNRRIWSAATNILVPGHYMCTHLVQKHGIQPDKVKVLPLWATPELTSVAEDPTVRSELGFKSDSLLLVHAGNIGLMHRIHDLIDAVGSVAQLNVEMAVTGGGTGFANAEKYAREKSITNIKFLGYVDSEVFTRLLQSADIGATTLINGMERLSMPSRSLTYMSAGLSIFSIMSNKSDVGELVVEGQCGWVAESTEVAVEILERLAVNRSEVITMSGNAFVEYGRRFARDTGIGNFARVISGSVEPKL
jgi:glycosyltransferase involved in cell wall biosynthesis